MFYCLFLSFACHIDNGTISVMPKTKSRQIKRPRHYKKRWFLSKWWRRYEYKHTTLAILSVVGFVLVLDTAVVQGLLLAIEEAGPIGIFLTGILFVSFFTAAPATIILVNIAHYHNPVYIALIAGLGSVFGDWLILQFFEEQIGYELKPLAKKYGIMPIIRQMRTKRFRPMAVIIAMFLIATPSPDEAGLALLGLTKTPMRKLLPVIYLLNAGGILLLVLGVRALIE